MKINNQLILSVSALYFVLFFSFIFNFTPHLNCCTYVVPSFLLSPVEPVSSWFIPGTGSLCPPANPHSQFGSPLSLSSSHGCERYSTLRNHRSAPYTSPYTHRTSSPSECPPPSPSCIQEIHPFLPSY